VAAESVNAQVDRPWGLSEVPDASPAAALKSFLRAIARHPIVFASVIVLCLLGAGAMLSRRAPSFQASAEILVSPVPATDESFAGLPLIRASELAPQRAAATAAPLLESPAAASLAAARLHTSPAAVSSAVAVSAVPGTNLVEVSAKGESAGGAAALANAYAEAALRVRDRFLAPQVRRAILETSRQIASLSEPNGADSSTLKARLADLRTIAHRGDPTLALAHPAPPGTDQNTPTKDALFLALMVGILLASLTAVMIDLLAARPIDSESELSQMYPLPVLARAREARRAADADLRRPLSDAPSTIREGFRTLRGQLELRARDGSTSTSARARGSTVLMVSPERDDGRAGCSLNLARAFSSVSETATVVELDVRNPRMAELLGVDPPTDISSLLSGAPVDSVAARLHDGAIGLIAAPPAVDAATREEITARSVEIVDEARRLGDWVVIDAPPITEAAADAIAALSAADYVVVVIRLRSTRPEALGLLRELFEQRGREPDGYLVLSGSSIWRWRSDSPT
jgi:Mrp family chromosome partitioning ATPase/capsular polysaccharide biosynthesis protein